MIYRLLSEHAQTSRQKPYGAEIVPFPGWEKHPSRDPDIDDEFHVLTPVIYTGDLEALETLDFPDSRPQRNLLISKQLVEALVSVRPFKYELYQTWVYAAPLRPVLDDYVHKVYHAQVWDEVVEFGTAHGLYEAVPHSERFVILKLLTVTDCLDADKTVVNGTPLRRTGTQAIDPDTEVHWEFIEPPGGFPPIFTIPEVDFYLFSEGAKTACERAELRGLFFNPLR